MHILLVPMTIFNLFAQVVYINVHAFVKMDKLDINNKALNKAWVNKWKHANLGKLLIKFSLLNPILLKLNFDRAIMFFKSYSKFALNLVQS